jgi:signal peptidase I
MDIFLRKLQEGTELFLTRRKQKKQRKKEKQKKKNVILDWIEAFLWAAFVVLLINQYLLQAYQIPSGSMRNTLLEEDRIFVNKIIYGPELLPGMIKLPGFKTPERAEVIIFENPSYIGKGPVFDILQRVIYMITLSMVDIDRDESGNPRPHFLIKRAVGIDGDRLQVVEGNLMIRPKGEDGWYTENEFKALSGLEYPQKRILTPDQYPIIKQAGVAAAYEDMRLGLPPGGREALTQYESIRYEDSIAFDRARTITLYSMNPHSMLERSRYHIHDSGWYIPEGYVFPMGDNRDNSRDARFFGPIPKQKVLGRAMFKYWPIRRIGAIR